MHRIAPVLGLIVICCAGFAAPAKVVRGKNEAIIQNVPVVSWGQSAKDCTFAGCLEAALAVTDHPYKYAEIMGYSGMAFRTRWWRWEKKPSWDPSVAVGEFPAEIAATSAATGWHLRIEKGPDKAPHMERFVPDIVKSINAGRPVLGYPPHLNVAVIVGYQDGGKTLLLRDYFEGQRLLQLPATKLGPQLIFLDKWTPPPTRREAVLAALRIAVANWKRERGPGDRGAYWYGATALKHWRDDLGNAGKLTDAQRENLFFVDWWNYEAFANARDQAVKFLGEATDVLGGKSAEAVARAAGLYAEEARLQKTAFGNPPAFLGPWTGKSVKDWSEDTRTRERDILARAQHTEEQAIAELEKALANAGTN
jgi:hypothetical protein